ncbi:MAG: hypothetical protein K9W42_05260 [Candidatus Heimdallarchaeota archaeon]|nr:hypothetical protein [Candidatus Heimdallarchaeota archaeon]
MKFQNYIFIEIERKKGASIAFNNGIDLTIAEKLLIEALPSGSPTDKFYRLIKLEGHLFLSVLHLMEKQDYGLALVVELSDESLEKNPIGIMNGCYTFLENLLAQSEVKFPEELEIKVKETNLMFDEFKDFDFLIFALLTSQKTVIVGDKNELEEFIGTMFECIPPQLRGHIRLGANVSTITDGEEISLVIISERVLRALDNRKKNYTVLLLPLKTAYGIYSSSKCKHIAKLYKEKKIESIKEEIQQLFNLALKSDELLPVADFAAKEHLEMADAFLVQWIRANHFGLEIEKSILEELDS